MIAPDYVAHKDSESPDSRYGVLVLSHEAAVDKDLTEGNTLPGKFADTTDAQRNPRNRLFRGTKSLRSESRKQNSRLTRSALVMLSQIDLCSLLL